MTKKEIITSKHKILDYSDIFNNTLSIYRDALSFIIEVVNEEWNNLEFLYSKEQFQVIEKLIHCTKKNKIPKYHKFDFLFYKFPCYFRRSATAEAVGIVSSYKSNLVNWELKKQETVAQGKRFKEKSPQLNLKHYTYPVFYKGNMFINHSFSKDKHNSCKIKVFYKNDWVWLDIVYKTNNLNVEGYEMKNPSLVKKGNKYYLHIPYERDRTKLNKTPIDEQIAIGIDLGLTNGAVCCAINSDGTVLGRRFINQPKEKDRMIKKLGVIAKAQRESGNTKKPNLWRVVNNYQEYITKDTASKIVKFAIEHNASVIVMEYLDTLKPNGNYYNRNKQKLHHWSKSKIQKLVEEMAHRHGIRIRRVNPKNTSALAFDGSGTVVRKKKMDICTFTTGKVYHADLNASYNIAGRYFTRELLKPLSEMTRLSLEAKVPSLTKQTSFVLSTLISLNKALATC